jgi:DNA polymerase-3 subunit delta
MMAHDRFYFFYGHDAYAVQQRAEEWIDTLTADSYMLEIFQPQGTAISDVERCFQEFQNAVQNLDLFSHRRVFWLRHIHFLADTPTGRSETVHELVEAFLKQWESSSEDICIWSACPVDRRTKIFKQLSGLGHSEFFPEAKTLSEILPWIRHTNLSHHITMEEEAMELLCCRVGLSKQSLVQEIEKLSLYGGMDGHITVQAVKELVPELIPGEFFEAVDLFYAADLEKALQGLRHYFATYREARPLLGALQHRNRLMLVLRYGLDTGALPFKGQRLSKTEWENFSAPYGSLFPQKGKNSFQIFQQNFWYLSRIAQDVIHFSFATLLDFQKQVMEVFFQIIRFHDHMESIMEQFFRYSSSSRLS